MNSNKKIGNFIKEKRIQFGWTQEQLASRLFVTRQAISKWERGLNIPDYDSLLHLSELFNLTINDILKSSEKF